MHHFVQSYATVEWKSRDRHTKVINTLWLKLKMLKIDHLDSASNQKPLFSTKRYWENNLFYLTKFQWNKNENELILLLTEKCMLI